VSDAGFVVAGWVITAAVLVGYWLSVLLRLRRAERTVPPAGDPTADPTGGPTP
jgi:hypothetical protein